MQTRTYAAIDIGSNSVRLMVARAEGDNLNILTTERFTTRLLNGLKDGFLTGDPAEQTAQAVAAHAETARSMGAHVIEAFGTSALRDAKNGSGFCEYASSLSGVNVMIISGVEEAQLAYAGAAPRGSCGVIDIGGGSTELIIGSDGKMLRAHSAQMGAVRLCNMLSGRLNPEEMVARAKEALHETVRTVCTSSPDKWVGVGGTITSLAAMTKKVSKYTPGAIEDFPITEDITSDWLRRLCGMPVEERRELIGLTPNRADIIPFGAAILLAVIQETGADPVHACDRDNLEGYIRSRLMTGSDT
ncbi:MAG: Ppx/GppA family phosphatase [Clostridia bacterium]|nr:Ppx/GppA family phosphatase [Clostridia bacterium]